MRFPISDKLQKTIHFISIISYIYLTDISQWELSLPLKDCVRTKISTCVLGPLKSILHLNFVRLFLKLSSARHYRAQDPLSHHCLSKYKCLKVTPDTFITFPLKRPLNHICLKKSILSLLSSCSVQFSIHPAPFSSQTEPVQMVNYMITLYPFDYFLLWPLSSSESTKLILLKDWYIHPSQCLSFPLIRFKWKWNVYLHVEAEREVLTSKHEAILNFRPTDRDGGLVYFLFKFCDCFYICHLYSTHSCSW